MVKEHESIEYNKNYYMTYRIKQMNSQNRVKRKNKLN